MNEATALTPKQQVYMIVKRLYLYVGLYNFSDMDIVVRFERYRS